MVRHMKQQENYFRELQMKKIVMLYSILAFASTANATTYTCYRYSNGEPTGTWIKISANSRSEAEKKAYKRMKEIGGHVDFVKCK